VGEEEIKETEFKTRSQYKRPNQTGDLEPKTYGVWIKKIPKKAEGKKTKTPKQKTQKRNSPKKALKTETKLFLYCGKRDRKRCCRGCDLCRANSEIPESQRDKEQERQDAERERERERDRKSGE
jgi:hypothetical protein